MSENQDGRKQKRERVAELDEEILRLLDDRLTVSRELEVAEEGPGDEAIFGAEELAARLKKIGGKETETLPRETAEAIFREIWSADKALRQPNVIAYLGPQATFTHQAALQYFGKAAEYAEQPSISDVFDTVSRGKATYGVAPIENTTEGSVTHTLDMFADTDIKIAAEINTPIHHCFLSSSSKEDVTTVYSHAQVFGQCRQWLAKNLPRAEYVELSSTTEATLRCSREENSAALASAVAADKYDVPVQEENIEDFTGNTTRFLVLSRHNTEPTGDDKTSLLMVIRDKVGALYDSLLPFRENGINLSFIQSRPSKRRNWEYYFFIDFNGHCQDEKVKQVLEELEEHCSFIKILGSYPRAVI